MSDSQDPQLKLLPFGLRRFFYSLPEQTQAEMRQYAELDNVPLTTLIEELNDALAAKEDDKERSLALLVTGLSEGEESVLEHLFDRLPPLEMFIDAPNVFRHCLIDAASRLARGDDIPEEWRRFLGSAVIDILANDVAVHDAFNLGDTQPGRPSETGRDWTIAQEHAARRLDGEKDLVIRYDLAQRYSLATDSIKRIVSQNRATAKTTILLKRKCIAWIRQHDGQKHLGRKFEAWLQQQQGQKH